VLGDEVYGKKQSTKVCDATGYTAPRQMLHARRITFDHPRTKKKVIIEAPWPNDFQQALSALRAKAR
jgi:23S rRNA pseudouridine1911/1915/1917 synthase